MKVLIVELKTKEQEKILRDFKATCVKCDKTMREVILAYMARISKKGKVTV